MAYDFRQEVTRLIEAIDPRPGAHMTVLCALHEAYEAGMNDAQDSGVLQAVLDAIAGKLDPHTQIADHPNVKFAQMTRLKWLDKAAQ